MLTMNQFPFLALCMFWIYTLLMSYFLIALFPPLQCRTIPLGINTVLAYLRLQLVCSKEFDCVRAET